MKKSGISLIALVITIAVLLILTGISIAYLTGDNGIVNQASESKKIAIVEDVKETAEVIKTNFVSRNDGNDPTSRYIIEKLIEQGKIGEDQVENYGDEDGQGLIVVEGKEIQITGTVIREAPVEDENIFIVDEGYILGLKFEYVDAYGIYGWHYTKEEYNNNIIEKNHSNAKIYSTIPDLVIPEEIDGVTIVGIGDYAFQSYDIKSIELPNTVTYIGASAFYECENLRNITIPSSVDTIGEYAFYGCYSLSSSIEIPDNVTTIGNYTFCYCKKLNSIKIGKSVSSIANNALNSTYELSSIVIDSENTTYDSRNNCNAIVETATNTLIIACKGSTVPETIQHIGDRAFFAIGVNSVTLPNSLIDIGEEAFRYCKMTTLDLGQNVQVIKNYAFEYTYLEELVIPNSVTTIEFNAFAYNKHLKRITVGNGVSTIGNNVFSFCNDLEEITFSSAPQTLGSDLFRYDYTLNNVVFPNGWTIIPEGMFYSCSALSNVYIPDSVTTIGRSAFANCTNLHHIYFPSSLKTINGGSSSNLVPFWCCPDDLTIYTPEPYSPSGWNYNFKWINYKNSQSVYATVKYNKTRAQYEAEVGL